MCLLATFREIIKTFVNDTSWSQIDGFLWRTFPAVSYTSIVSISVDRFLMVVYPLHHRYWMKGKTMAVWLACIWIVSFTFPAKWLAFGSERYDNLIVNFLGLTLILFSAAMYALTYRKLRKQIHNIVLNNSSDRNSRAHAVRVFKEKKFLTTIIVIACITVVFMVPLLVFYQVAILPGLLKDPAFATQIILNICYLLYYCNFTVNPFIYIARLPNYRKTFYLLYCRRIISCRKLSNGLKT